MRPEQLFGGCGSLSVAVGMWVDRSYHDNSIGGEKISIPILVPPLCISLLSLHEFASCYKKDDTLAKSDSRMQGSKKPQDSVPTTIAYREPKQGQDRSLHIFLYIVFTSSYSDLYIGRNNRVDSVNVIMDKLD